jgi:ribosomal protein L40E
MTIMGNNPPPPIGSRPMSSPAPPPPRFLVQSGERFNYIVGVSCCYDNAPHARFCRHCGKQMTMVDGRDYTLTLY